MSEPNREDVLILFDVDGTLTSARQTIAKETEDALGKLMKKASVGLVSGSDLPKVSEQMGGDEKVFKFDYVFPENGLVAYEKDRLVAKENIAKFIGEEKIQSFINFSLKYMSGIELPVKRGNFVEFRNGLINLCPVGRSCTYEERLEFNRLDLKEKIREKFVDALKAEFPDLGMTFAIGGQISIDAFPYGWDKRYCLSHLAEKNFKEIHFFGDRVEQGGNDHHIFEDPRTIGHAVTSPQDTVEQLDKLFDL